MKIVCNKSDLVKGVNIVSKAVPGKTTMPILECILIDAANVRVHNCCRKLSDSCCNKE